MSLMGLGRIKTRLNTGSDDLSEAAFCSDCNEAQLRPNRRDEQLDTHNVHHHERTALTTDPTHRAHATGADPAHDAYNGLD